MKPRYRTAFAVCLVFGTCVAELAAQIPQMPARAGGGAPSTVILGIVTDTVGRPLVGAAVTIRAGSDSSIVTGALTNDAGRFRIEGLAPATYHLHISYIGYRRQEQDVALTPAALTANLGTIKLVTDVIAVQGVTAEAVRSAVTVDVDRNIYSTKNMPAATGGSTTDLLRNVPELDVDVEGNVKLQGSQSVALHINGRPAPMRGEALKNFLQMLPATRVDRVEIVPNPSAKYDPEGIAGIVNIVLKENVDLGFSGSLGFNADTRGNHGTNGNLNYQKGKLTLFGNAALSLQNHTMRLSDRRENLLASPRTYLWLDANNDMGGYFTWFDGSVEYKLSKTSTLYASARGNIMSRDMDGFQQYQLLNASQLPTLAYNFQNDNEFGFGNNDASLGLRRVVKPQQNELTLELRRTGNSQRMEQDYTKTIVTPVGEPLELGLTDNDTDVAEYSLKADYVRMLTPKLKLETGYKGATRGTDYANQLERFSGTSPTPFKTQRSDFTYDEDYHQAYALVGRQFGKFGVQAGARGEIATTDFALPGNSSYANDYESLFPSLNLSYSKGPAFTARVAYSKRIDRPQPNMLNPGVPSADSLNKFVGNPNLRPKYTHSFTMDLTRSGTWGMFKFAPYYRETTDNWDYFKLVDSTGVATLTWQNTSSVKAYGANTTLSLRKGATANGFISFNAYRFERDASNLSAAYSGDGFRWDVSGNGMTTLRPGTMVQLFARYQAPQDMPQGRISSSVFSNIGLRHQLLDKKGSINLSIVDPLDLFRFKFETRDATHIQNSENKVSIRSVRLGFTYAFGKPPQPTVRRSPDEQQQPDATPQIR